MSTNNKKKEKIKQNQFPLPEKKGISNSGVPVNTGYAGAGIKCNAIAPAAKRTLITGNKA